MQSNTILFNAALNSVQSGNWRLALNMKLSMDWGWKWEVRAHKMMVNGSGGPQDAIDASEM